MKTAILIILASVTLVIRENSNDRPWQKFSDLAIKEIKPDFITPPAQYGSILWWGWDGEMTDTVIMRDLDAIKKMGFTGVMLEAGYGMKAKYLSPEWFEMVKLAVDEAEKRGMIVWIEDEGKYPSGFAGGKFSQERPDLKMRGLVVTERIDLKPGEPLVKKCDPGTLSAVAVSTSDNSYRIIDVSNGEIRWSGDAGTWRILVAGYRFRSSQTRSVNNPTRGKDTTASLMDYLNPAATRQFLDWTHEQYKKYIGNHFGKTFMGFMGDEPDFAYTPWTPGMLQEFTKRKGYDVSPWLAAFFLPQMSAEVKRVKADYWDVWSDLFSKNFFKVQADWCRENNLEYIVHLNHEDQLMGLVRSSGDFFRNMRHVAVPGIDAIWAQIWMDHVADYPKLASSASHLFGRPRSFTESFAAYTYRPTVPQAKWVIDYQLVRGINSVQIMFMSASVRRAPAPPPSTQKPGAKPVVPRTSFFRSDTFPPVAAYINRATYLLSQGRPASRTGLYVPVQAMWCGETASYDAMLKASRQLLENQLDFDFIDEQALSGEMKLSTGTFVNLSNQEYKTIIIPDAVIMSKQSLTRLKQFAASGGKVIFLGKLPSLAYDRTISSAEPIGDLGWAAHEPSGEISQSFVKQTGMADLSLGKPCPHIKYLHRKLKDGELYFIFNESREEQSNTLLIEGSGRAEIWDAMTGKAERVKNVSKEGDKLRFQLNLLPWETKFIVISD